MATEPTNIFTSGSLARAEQVNQNFREVIDDWRNFTYGETIAVNDALFLARGNEIRWREEANQTTQNADQILTTNIWYSQTILTSARATRIRNISFFVKNGAIIECNFTLRIRAVDATQRPTGDDLFTAAFILPASASSQWITVSVRLPISANTRYAIILHQGANVQPRWHFWNADVYVDGRAFESVNSGGTWTEVVRDFTFRIEEEQEWTTAGLTYRTRVEHNDEQIHNFVGFAKEAGVLNDIRKVQVSGIVSGFSDLITGALYFLSNTAGAIATTAGTFEKRIGIAMSVTRLLIRTDIGDIVPLARLKMSTGSWSVWVSGTSKMASVDLVAHAHFPAQRASADGTIWEIVSVSTLDVHRIGFRSGGAHTTWAGSYSIHTDSKLGAEILWDKNDKIIGIHISELEDGVLGDSIHFWSKKEDNSFIIEDKKYITDKHIFEIESIEKLLGKKINVVKDIDFIKLESCLKSKEERKKLEIK